MQKFAVIFSDEVVEYQRFYCSMNVDNFSRFFCRLVGFKIKDQTVYPDYQPIFSHEKKENDQFFEIHFTRWTSLVININKTGFHWKWFDIRKEYGGD